MVRSIAIIICAIIYLNSYSQENKVLLYKFNSDLEKTTFETFESNGNIGDYIASMCAIDSLIDSKDVDVFSNRIQKIINTLPLKKENKATKEKKRLEKIYKRIHDEFFKKYVFDANFSQIFINGEYNCVSASALYAFIFEKIEIPYAIKEEPGHVFVIAYPDSHKIYLETTVPGESALYSLDETHVKKIVKELVDVKLISQEELDQKGYVKAYQDYFFSKDYLKLEALIGVQYYNKAIANLSAGDFKQASININKAEVFYRSEITNYLKSSILKVLLYENELKSERDIIMLIESLKVLEYNKDFDKKDIKMFIYKIISNNEADEKVIGLLNSKLPKIDNDEVTLVALEFLNMYAAEEYASNDDYDLTMKYANNVLELNTENKTAKKLITWAIQGKVKMLPLNENSLEILIQYQNEYPFLNDNNRINSFKGLLYGRLAYDNFSTKKISDAESYLKKLEDMMVSHPGMQINPELYCTIYLKGGQHYFGKMKLNRAEEMLRKGLEFNPDHIDLKRVLKYVLEEK